MIFSDLLPRHTGEDREGESPTKNAYREEIT
jgi:hypothetical protein